MPLKVIVSHLISPTLMHAIAGYLKLHIELLKPADSQVDWNWMIGLQLSGKLTRQIKIDSRPVQIRPQPNKESVLRIGRQLLRLKSQKWDPGMLLADERISKHVARVGGSEPRAGSPLRWPENALPKCSSSPGAKSRSRTRISYCSRSQSTPSSTSRATTSP